jgi:YjbE family integral membrane protein
LDALFSDVSALIQVILIDLALAGDNAIAVGLAASALEERQRKRVIFIGVALALGLRIVFALLTVQLLKVPGLLLIGGLLLLWVAWRMWEDVRQHHTAAPLLEPEEGAAIATHVGGKGPPQTFGRALLSIIIADVSMSLDNVLAVAGVARHNEAIMAFGLILSVVLMGVAASLIAGVIQKYRWIATLGIVVIVFAAIRMVWEDLHTFFPLTVPGIPTWLGGRAPHSEASLDGFFALASLPPFF